MDNEINPSSFSTLLEQFESTKKELVDAEKNIRRLTGRDPDVSAGENIKGQLGLGQKRSQQILNSDKPFPGRKRPLFPIVKPKEEEEEPQEESAEEDETPSKKPSLLSTVVANPKDSRSRKETIQEQNINSKVKARNRRMFGMILGTLQKFQHDAKKREEKDLKRAVIEQKVEAAAAEEKERIKKEKEELFQIRREKQAQLRCLEKKLEIAELHEVWESNEKHMVNFIITKCHPSICFLPATHNSKTSKCLETSRKKTLEHIKERREKMEKELLEIEELYKRSNFPSDKENIGPVDDDGLNELTDSQDQNGHQESSDIQLESQDSEQQLPDKLEPPISSEDFQEIGENAIPPQELLNKHEVSGNLDETSAMETVSMVTNDHVTDENDENTTSERTDQDFEPIYD